jgi:hypothetical protein
MNGTSEKRQTPRIQPFVAPCRYLRGEARQPGFLTDLSLRGGRVHTDGDPPSVAERVTIEIRLSRRPTPLAMPAIVEWVKASPRGGHVFGVSFESAPSSAREVLSDVVEEFRRRAASIDEQ